MKSFAGYKQDAPNWITMAGGEYYPDILSGACELYKPVLVTYGQLLKTSETSIRLLQQITDIKQPWMRVQLCRVFRKYVSPQTPVEMLKKKSMIPMVCELYGSGFRPINEVQAAFNSRPCPTRPFAPSKTGSSTAADLWVTTSRKSARHKPLQGCSTRKHLRKLYASQRMSSPTICLRRSK